MTSELLLALLNFSCALGFFIHSFLTGCRIDSFELAMIFCNGFTAGFNFAIWLNRKY